MLTRGYVVITIPYHNLNDMRFFFLIKRKMGELSYFR